MRRVLIAAATVLAATACGGSDGEASDAQTSESPAAEESSATAEPTETATPAGPVALGEEQTTPFGRVTVLQVRPTVDVGEQTVMEALGMERWAAAEVRTCVDQTEPDDPVKLSWGPWSLEDRQGGVYSYLDVTGINQVDPVYPMDGSRTTLVGTCAKGWIMFDVAEGARLANVVYESEVLPEPLVWTI